MYKATLAYGNQHTRKDITMTMTMRVTSFSARWVVSDSCCCTAACTGTEHGVGRRTRTHEHTHASPPSTSTRVRNILHLSPCTDLVSAVCNSKTRKQAHAKVDQHPGSTGNLRSHVTVRFPIESTGWGQGLPPGPCTAGGYSRRK